MSVMKVSGEALAKVHSALVCSEQDLEEIVAVFEKEVETLRSLWSGEASDAYDLAQSKWSANLQEMHRILGGYRASVLDADTNYRETSRIIGKKIWG